MGKQIEAVDQYIEKSGAFARPVLEHLRDLIHRVCPEVEEKMKWSFPHFDYRGEMMCHFASFKEHMAFGFWKGSILPDPHGVLRPIGETGMGNFGRVTSLKDLPSDEVLADLIRAHMDLNERGIKLPRSPKKDPAELQVPQDLLQALAESPNAQSTFDGFNYSNKRDYVSWIEEAKTGATRAKRLQQAVEWMAEGKTRNWKYERK